jgi:superfamily I DNA/RNA helicase
VERLAAHGVTPTVREPLVRTVHSYAFAVLRLNDLRRAPIVWIHGYGERRKSV